MVGRVLNRLPDLAGADALGGIAIRDPRSALLDSGHV